MAELPKDKTFGMLGFLFGYVPRRESRSDVPPEGGDSKKHIMKRGS